MISVGFRDASEGEMAIAKGAFWSGINGGGRKMRDGGVVMRGREVGYGLVPLEFLRNNPLRWAVQYRVTTCHPLLVWSTLRTCGS